MLYHKHTAYEHIPGEIRVREIPVWLAQNVRPPLPVVPVPWWFYVGLLCGELILAVVLGIFSSLLAVMRYIK